MSKIIYTLHALKRLRERGIHKFLVEDCIKNPCKVISEDNVKKAIKRIDNRVLVVVYRVENDIIVVITAYISSKIRKYF